MLEDVLTIATDDITERLYALLRGEKVVAKIDQNVVYRSLAEDPANIYSLLLVAGYLKTPKKEIQVDGAYLCEVSMLDNQYRIKSNRESGDGRYDISLIPREKKYPGMIMELKWKSGLEEAELEKLSIEALSKIDEKRYDLELKEEGIENVIKFGIAFSGKKVVIKTK